MSLRNNPQNWLLLFLLTLIWGSSYILIKKGLLGFTPFQLASLRISCAFICSLPLAVKAMRVVPRQKYFTILQAGIISTAIPAFLFALSMTKSESGVTGILNALSPLWTVLIGYFLYHVAISGKKIGGVAMGFVGAVVLVLGKKDLTINTNIIYNALPVLATFCYGMGTNITKQKLQNENQVYTTSLGMSMIGIPAFTAFLFSGAPAKIATGQVWLPLAAVATLGIMGTFVAWILFNRLVQRTDALFATSVTYLVPIVAISWGILDGEVLTAIQFGGMLLILAGVYFTTKK